MQELRCVKCHKVIGKSPTLEGYLTKDQLNVYVALDGSFKKLSEKDKVVEIQCPHNYRDENGKNVQCKALNKVVI